MKLIQNTLSRRSAHVIRVVLVTLATFCAGHDCLAVTGITKWAVIKCKFSDRTATPPINPAVLSGSDGLAGYWSGVSYGQISLAGSAVYPTNGGWYTLPITFAQAQAMTRDQVINACVSAAGSDLTVSDFYSVIAIVNVSFEYGSDGQRLLLNPVKWYVSIAAHEMGHVYLPGDADTDHSWDDTTTVYCPGYPPGLYGNSWDIMSAENYGGLNTTFTNTYGPAGPGLNAHNVDKLGWLPAARVATWNGSSQNFVLAALNRPAVGGYLVAKVPFDGSDPNHYYTVEFRRKTDWDQGIPQDTVLIHEVRSDTRSILIRANGGAERLAGQRFVDATNNVAISVLNIDSVGQTATVNIGRNDVWVDFTYAGLPFFPETGSFVFPDNTVAEGVSRVASGGTIHFKPGSSSERPTITKQMSLEAYNGPVTIGQ